MKYLGTVIQNGGRQVIFTFTLIMVIIFQSALTVTS